MTETTGLDRILRGEAPAFALLYRPESAGPGRIDVLVGDVSTVDSLGDLPLPDRPTNPGPPGLPRHDLLAVVPYRQIAERGFACPDDGTPLAVMTVRSQGTVAVSDAVRRISDAPVVLRNESFDIDDETYAATVRKVLTQEIGQGEGSNFVMKRSFVADIADYSPLTALAIFRRLLRSELGTYWTFVVHTGSRTLVGATPEQHVSLSGGTVTMNPISGTYRYPPSGPSVPELMRFLVDRKETDELYMVVDEELKMMARVCRTGARVVGPYLKEMARLAHTEYRLEGETSLDVREILRETMFAPTVTGSPLENACRVISRYEPQGRGYYSGALALIGRDAAGAQTLDASILIRSADIDTDGRMEIGVGATLVRHSDPESEVEETRAKTAGVLAALASGAGESPETDRRAEAATDFARRVGADPQVRRLLDRRNATLAGFWRDRGSRDGAVPELAGRRVLVVDAEDTFTAMLGHVLRSLGLDVTIQQFHEPFDPDGFDFVVVGPGPGDPRDQGDAKIAKLWEITRGLLRDRVPFLSVCLGHQVLAAVLGFEIIRREVPNQGVQLEIDLFGWRERVGFYNTFTARCDHDQVERPGVPGTVELSRDAATGQVHALRGPRFRSLQFHPESVLTEHGVRILREQFESLLPTASAVRG